MLSFAKTTEFQEDLYAGLVAPTLQSNLLTETWNNGDIIMNEKKILEIKEYYIKRVFKQFNVSFKAREH